MYVRSRSILYISAVLLLLKFDRQTSVVAFSAKTLSHTTPQCMSISSRSSSSSSRSRGTNTRLFHGPPSTAIDKTSFIDTELRGAAMKLHTTMQAPKEGKVVVQEPKEKYIPTHADYLQFLVDSQYVYQALEDIVNSKDDLKKFRNTGLERVHRLSNDIKFISKEYNVPIPEVGKFGTTYAKQLRDMASIPEFMCHYYNYYFAHTAGGRMIGKSLAKLLLDNKVLEFYKWDDNNLNVFKKQVKQDIEDMVSTWTRQEKDECLAGTPGAFSGGGGINRYLGGPDAVNGAGNGGH